MKVHNSKNLLQRRRELRKSPTEAEKIIWDKLRGNKLGVRFKREHSVGGYILDFYCFQARLIIELDGPIHDFNKEYDEVRDKFFSDLDYQTLRIKNQEITENLPSTIEKIKKTLSLRLGEGGATPGRTG